MKNERLDKLDEFLERLFGPGIEPSAEDCVSDGGIEELCDRLGARIAALRARRDEAREPVATIGSNAICSDGLAVDDASQ